MKTSTLALFFMALTFGSHADVPFDAVGLVDGSVVGIEEIKEIHRFDDGEIDFLELVNDDIVEGIDIDGFVGARGGAGGGNSARAGAGGGNHHDPAFETLPRGAGGKGAPIDGTHARLGAGGGNSPRL